MKRLGEIQLLMFDFLWQWKTSTCDVHIVGHANP